MAPSLFAYPCPHGLAVRAAWACRVGISAVVVALAAGCGASASWDREYACEGQESSVAQFQGANAPAAVRKSYPLSIDLHVRDPHVFVKGTTSDVRSRSDGDTHFAVRSASFWMAGGFDERTGSLTLVEERTLTIAGKVQMVRNSGTFSCRRKGAAPQA